MFYLRIVNMIHLGNNPFSLYSLLLFIFMLQRTGNERWKRVGGRPLTPSLVPLATGSVLSDFMAT